MSHYMNPIFWWNLLDRAIRTFAQALLAVLGADGVGLLDVDWGTALSVAAMATLLSMLTSIATPTAVEEGAAEAYTARHAKR